MSWHIYVMNVSSFESDGCKHDHRSENLFQHVIRDALIFSLMGSLLHCQVTAGGLPPVPRVAHTAAAVGTNIYIFGGR